MLYCSVTGEIQNIAHHNLYYIIFHIFSSEQYYKNGCTNSLNTNKNVISASKIDSYYFNVRNDSYC